MSELLSASLPFLPVTLLVLVLLLLAPQFGEVGRRRLVALFGLGAVALIVFATQHASAKNTVAVVNPFPIGDDMKSTPVLVETVTAAGWQWPVVAAVFLALVALGQFGALRMAPRAPSPVVHCVFVATALAVLRLLLEKNAAPQALAWAVGGSIGLPILVGFAGFYAGRRAQGFASFALSLLLLAVVQRAILTGIAWFATMRRWGTHLDVNAVTRLHTPIGGVRTFGDDPVGKWIWAILVPQMVLWVAVTVGLGLVVGTVGWVIGRRR